MRRWLERMLRIGERNRRIAELEEKLRALKWEFECLELLYNTQQEDVEMAQAHAKKCTKKLQDGRRVAEELVKFLRGAQSEVSRWRPGGEILPIPDAETAALVERTREGK